MKRVLLTALGLTAALLPGPAAHASGGYLQPGDYMVAGSSACTTNFVYDGTGSLAGKVYLGTAAHCVTNVGQDVADINGTVWGDVALIGDQNSTAPDYAFIEVRAAHVSRVRAWVKGYPNYPTGYTTSNETATGDLVQVSGYGLGFDLTNVTQEKRQAVLTFDDAQTHNVLGPIDFGDSGGPLVHVKTGKALGIVSRLCTGACSETGPTVQGIIAKAAARGFTVTLRTV
ncbi:MAG TPA: trypsin-like serine protease [Mycobacteriales bacterium]|nr:trypsin-like serine protease [Mycobacteriales bacterium]